MRYALPLVVLFCSLIASGIEAPQLVSEQDGEPGQSASGTNGFGGAVASPVLDDGRVFFLTLTPFTPFDENGLVDVYSGPLGELDYVSLAGRLPQGTPTGNAEAVGVSHDGSVVAVSRYELALDPFPRAAILNPDATIVSRTPLTGNPEVTGISLSGDGSRLVLVSPTDGLVPTDSNGRPDLFHYALADDTLSPIATTAAPTSVTIGTTGGLIAFVAGGALHVYDVNGNATTVLAAAGSAVTGASVSGNGAWIAFSSAQDGLVTGDQDGLADAFVIRTDGSEIRQVSVLPSGEDFTTAAGSLDRPVLSEDGRFVCFVAGLPGRSAAAQIWLRDTQQARTYCLSVSAGSALADVDCRAPAIAAGGRYITFCSAATNLSVPAATVRQVYLVDLGPSWLDVIPVAPSRLWLDDVADVIAWEWVLGYETASDYEISLDGGASWAVATGNPSWVGNLAVAAGQIMVRVRAGEGNAAGDSVAAPAGLTETADPADWSLAIVCPALAAGAVLGLTDSPWEDSGALPDATHPGICLLDPDSDPLSAQLLTVADEAEWQIVIRSPDAVATVWRWAIPPAFPVDSYLSLWEVDEEGVPVGQTAVDMAETSSLQVPAGEQRRFVARFAPDRTVDVALVTGWNLLSVPISPQPAELTTVFADGRAALVSDVAHVWVNGASQATAVVTGLTGTWVYALRAAKVLVRGTPVDMANLEFVEGWNLLSVPVPVEVSSLTSQVDLTSGFLEWLPATLRYQSVTTLMPGGAYWVRSAETVSLPLGLLVTP
ncbi:MAG: hypothetical protein HN380_18565 [Victivallales bacterium]|nr:hypothetical protein [Victivallales bacterium]